MLLLLGKLPCLYEILEKIYFERDIHYISFDKSTNSTETMKQRYFLLPSNTHCPAIYESFIKEKYCVVLIRWHPALIETGRYNRIGLWRRSNTYPLGVQDLGYKTEQKKDKKCKYEWHQTYGKYTFLRPPYD